MAGCLRATGEMKEKTIQILQGTGEESLGLRFQEKGGETLEKNRP